MSEARSRAPWSRYWGKAEPDGAVPGCHLLAFHSLDVAAVGRRLLESRSSWLASFAAVAEVERDGLVEALSFLLALHDLGKFGDGFQHLCPDLSDQLERSTRPVANRPRHDSLGYLLWRELSVPGGDDEVVEARLSFVDATGGVVPARKVRSAQDAWVAAVAGHHGRPPSLETHPHAALADHFAWGRREGPWRDASAFIREAHALLASSAKVRRTADAAALSAESLKRSSWWLAGFTTLCDWVGSNRQWFPYESTPSTLADYWPRALERAERAIAEAGLVQRRTRPFGGFDALFPGFTPTPLQRHASEFPLGEGPQLFLIEDLTGSGKTEAALTLVARLCDAGRADGLFFALPTMATANAMHGRVASVLGNIFESDPPPSLVLAHSGPKLRAPALGLGGTALENQNDAGYGGEASASIAARSWLTDSRKKALLADAGVGTIDQALVGVLQAKHSTLRLLGLHHHVLVVDEVHACDEYMNGLLGELLRMHAANGGSVVLLSATLPVSTRQKLVDAFRSGLGRDESSAPRPEYPLLVRAGRDHVETCPMPIAPGSERCVEVAFQSGTEAVVAWCEQRVSAGRCVAWMRNTVRDALDAYDTLVARLGPARVQLFHARFPMGDRLAIEQDVVARFGKTGSLSGREGRVVVATQVLEQSLDVDFDDLVTDLAPIDRVIQRAGRLQRHRHRAERGAPTLHVLAPPWTMDPTPTWPGPTFRGTSAVYERPSTLWRTQRVLREEGALRLPMRARYLVESVYGPAVDLPATLDTATREVSALGNELRQRSMARHNRVSLEQGYLRTGLDWDEDEFVPTRLGDPTTTVRFVRREGETLRPWADAAFGDLAWRLGELSVRAELVVSSAESEALRLRLAALQAEPPAHVVPVEMTLCGDSWQGVSYGAPRTGSGSVRNRLILMPGRGLEVRATSGEN